MLNDVSYKIEFEREDDGRWIAAIPQLPGVMVYGQTQDEATSRVEALALRVIAGQIEGSGTVPREELERLVKTHVKFVA